MNRHAWKLDGLCQQVDPDLFFPGLHQSPKPAKRVCAACPVRGRCLEEALKADEQGIWGGTTEDERRALRRNLPAGYQFAGRSHRTFFCGYCRSPFLSTGTVARYCSRRCRRRAEVLRKGKAA
jgi:WhiB family redox-sensing transcriptional regulator